MENKRSYGIKFIICLFCVLVVFSTISVGTLASFSAKYNWVSNEGVAGNFNFQDTNFDMNLFGDEPIYPGDGNKVAIQGVDFESNSVNWSIVETNENDLPLVFYVEKNQIVKGFYSKYNYASNFTDKYVNVGDNKIQCQLISNDITVFTQSLEIGVKVCWYWVGKIFNDSECENEIEKTNSAYKTFWDKNKEFCTEEMQLGFGNLTKLNGVTDLEYVATKESGNNFVVEQLNLAETKFQNVNGKLTYNGKLLNVFNNGVKKEIDENYEFAENDCYILFISMLKANKLEDALETSQYELNKAVSYSHYNSTMEVGSGVYRKVKLLPTRTAVSKAKISLKISAEVTK